MMLIYFTALLMITFKLFIKLILNGLQNMMIYFHILIILIVIGLDIFSSRANLKGYVREVSKDFNSQSIFLALDYLINGEQTFSSFENLFRTMGVLQHHDAITGTERQFVANFYSKVLSQSVDIERNQFLESYKRVTRSSIEDLSLCKAHNSTYKDCPTKTLDDPNTGVDKKFGPPTKK